jgi:transcriptional regulator with XRE-family HTH domain
MATTLAPVDSREVVRCDHCQLVQFRSNNNNCRRCRRSLEEDEPVPVLVPMPVVAEEAPSAPRSELQVAASIRALRLRAGLSQRQLAGRMNVPRTYVSKIENDKAMPTLSSLERLARALGVAIPELLRPPACHADSRELLGDPFLQLLLPDLLKLDAMHRSMFLHQVREMASGRRRSA